MGVKCMGRRLRQKTDESDWIDEERTQYKASRCRGKGEDEAHDGMEQRRVLITGFTETIPRATFLNVYRAPPITITLQSFRGSLMYFIRYFSGLGSSHVMVF